MSSGRTLTWAVRLGAVLAAGAAVAGFLLWLGTPEPYRSKQPWRPEHVMALVYPAAGAFLLSRRPRLTVGWLLWGMGLVAALMVLLTALGRWAVLHDLPGAGHLRWASIWIYLLEFVPLITLLPLLYPDGRPPSPRWRPVLVLVYVLLALNVLLVALLPATYGVGPLRVANPVGVDLVGRLAPLHPPLEWATVATALVCIASLGFRFRAGDPVLRRQIGWLAYAVLAVAVIGCSDMVADIPFPVWAPLISAAVAAVPVCVGIAILRYRLYDIDLIVNRTLVYGALAVVTGVVYFGLVGAVGLLVADQGAAAGLGGAVTVGAIFHPLRLRLQRAVDRLFKIERDPYVVADRLSRTVQQASDPTAALLSALVSARQALGAAGAAVEVDGVAAHSDGTTDNLTVHVPLVWHGEPVGRLLLPPGRRDDRLVRLLARHLADVAHAVRLTTDLQRSRERILGAREEERRRLRRDLHDGLGPTLAALALSLDAARLRLRTDPESVSASLSALRERMISTIGDIRELVYGLRPPALDALGLEGALRALAVDLPEPPVELTASGELTDLPAAVEVAAYRIVQEALTNARRHSGAQRVTVRLARDAELVVVVADDGVGLPAEGTARAGIGLSSMRERAAELGGGCTIGVRSGGGTEVVVRLPLTSGRGALHESHARR